MNSSWILFSDLSNHQLLDAMIIRQEVFVVEQKCLYRDADQWDSQSVHGFLRNEGGVLVSYARITPPNSRFSVPSFGRVATHPDHRSQGYAARLVDSAIAEIKKLYPETSEMRISAQTYLTDYYGRWGFQPVGEYLEDGIPHTEMLLKLEMGSHPAD